jgi:hypothetical protein
MLLYEPVLFNIFVFRNVDSFIGLTAYGIRCPSRTVCLSRPGGEHENCGAELVTCEESETSVRFKHTLLIRVNIRHEVRAGCRRQKSIHLSETVC